MRFLKLRDMLIEQRGWNRRVATLAARLYLGVDTPVDLVAVTQGDWGRTLLTEGEYRTVLDCW